MFWIETIHGVTVDIVNTLLLAKKQQADALALNQTPRRVFTCGAKGKRVYL